MRISDWSSDVCSSFLDRLPVGSPLGADGPVLDVDDQQRRSLADAAGTAEAGRFIPPVFVLGNDAAPGPRDGRCGFRGLIQLAHGAALPFSGQVQQLPWEVRWVLRLLIACLIDSSISMCSELCKKQNVIL